MSPYRIYSLKILCFNSCERYGCDWIYHAFVLSASRTAFGYYVVLGSVGKFTWQPAFSIFGVGDFVKKHTAHVAT